MQLLSPYGKDVSKELRRVYGLESVTALGELVRRHLAQAYGLTNVVLESAHIAYGLAVRVRADDQTYYLKFASRSMNRAPEVLFGLVNDWSAQGVPVPQVLPSVSGQLFYNLLPGSDYDVIYLMDALPGGLMLEVTDARLTAYAGLMVQVHQIGSHHIPRVHGGEASRFGWRDRVEAAHTSALVLAQRTDRLRVTTCNALRTALAGMRNSLPTTDLPRTHIHGCSPATG